MNQPNPYAAPQQNPSPEQDTPPRYERENKLWFRWWIIPMMLCGFFGPLCLTAAIIRAGMMVWTLQGYGPFEERIDPFDLTAKNLGELALTFAIALALLVSCWASWRMFKAQGRGKRLPPEASPPLPQ